MNYSTKHGIRRLWDKVRLYGNVPVHDDNAHIIMLMFTRFSVNPVHRFSLGCDITKGLVDCKMWAVIILGVIKLVFWSGIVERMDGENKRSWAPFLESGKVIVVSTNLSEELWFFALSCLLIFHKKNQRKFSMLLRPASFLGNWHIKCLPWRRGVTVRFKSGLLV